MIKHFAKRIDFKIPENLQEYIVCVIHGQSDSPIHLTYPVHSSGYPLLINIYGNVPTLQIGRNKMYPKSRLNLAGQVCGEDIQIEIDGVFGQIGFVLQPTTPYYLFQKSGSYFLNSWRSARDLLSNDYDGLLQALNTSKNVMTRLNIMAECLHKLSLKRLPSQKWLDRTLKEVFDSNGQVSQNRLAEISGFSFRHFRRRFKEIIGVPPKYYCKVIQMNTFFEIIKSADEKKLNALAIDCGYYDQSHFIRDFNTFIGESPRNFLGGNHAFVSEYLGRM